MSTDEPITKDAGCDVCGTVLTEPQDEYLSVDSGETNNFCSWACLASFAATRAHEYEARLEKRLAELQPKPTIQ